MREERLFGGTMINAFLAKTHLPGHRRTWRRLMVVLVALGLLLALLSPAAAADGTLDPTFNNPLVQKIPIIRGLTNYSIPPPINNNLRLIHGYFTKVDVTGQPTAYRYSIARLIYGAIVDTNFNPPTINGEVRGVKVLTPTSANSQIIIWGQFTLSTTIGQTTYTYNNLARLNSDGSVDISFNNGTSGTSTFTSDGGVWSVFVDGSGNLLVGGYSLKITGDAGSTAYHLLRLNSSGGFDNSYTGARSVPGGYVTAMWTGPLYKGYTNPLVICGTLPRPSTTHNDYILIRDSADFVTQVANIGDEVTDGPIYNMVPWTVNTTTYWLIVGNFKKVYTTASSRVARLNFDLSTPTLDPGFNNLGDGANGMVNKIYITGNAANQVILAGNFSAFGGNSSADPPVPATPCGYLVRLNPDGSLDPTFTGNNGTGADDRIFGLGGSPNPFITGAFRSFNGSISPPNNLRGGIAVIDIDGHLQPGYSNLTAGSDTPGTVYAQEWDQTGFIIGGDFTGVGGKLHQNLARLNWDGSVDPSFTHNVDGVVYSLRQSWTGSGNNQMLVAGNFGAANAVGCTSLARWNMDSSVFPHVKYSYDYSFKPTVTKADGTLGKVRMAEAGYEAPHNIIIGGNFDNIDGTGGLNSVALLTSAGALANGFSFTPPSGLSKIRINAGGSMDTSYVMVGKATYSGDERGFGWRLNSDGSLDNSFAIGQSPVANVALFDDEVINGGGGEGPNSQFYLCGNFTQVNNGTSFSIPRGRIARFNANGTLDATWAPAGADGPICSLDFQPNGKMLIGGLFTQYNGTPRNAFARLNRDGSLDTGFNPGGSGPNGAVFMVTRAGSNFAFLGGAFTSYNGTPMGGLARVLDQWKTGLPPLLLLLDD